MDLIKNVKTKIFLEPLFGALPQIGDWIQKYVQICHGFKFSKMVIKSVLVDVKKNINLSIKPKGPGPPSPPQELGDGSVDP